jgi:hypothetical protein
VGLTSADCQLPIVNWPLGIEAIGNRQLAITRPTRYRVVVLTSWDRRLSGSARECRADATPNENNFMTWIKTVPASEDERVRKASEGQRHLYPIEYATPVHPTLDGETAGIVESHSLIPDALYHAFATYGSLLSPDLPLQRHQHEMIATVVSVTNRCHY